MGYERYEDASALHPKLQDLRYHSDWNWLMAVVEKIDKLAVITIRPGICTIDRFYMNKRRYAKENNIPLDEVPPLAESNEKDFIGNVHEAVHQYITWYNNYVNNAAVK